MRLAAFDDGGVATMGVVDGSVLSPLCPVDAFYAEVDGWLARAAHVDTPARPWRRFAACRPSRTRPGSSASG